VEFKQLWSKLVKPKVVELEPGQEVLNALVNVPRHLAIIMDGNGRWARKRGLPRALGHRAGVETLRAAVTTCSNLEIKVLTVYAFSTENWKRPRSEVDILMNLLTEYLQQEAEELNRNHVQIRAMGHLDELPEAAQLEVERAGKLTRNNQGLILNLALNYGGRGEILQAVRRISELVKQGKLQPEDVNEELFDRFLYTAGLSDPDLIIRTSGEMRISNYMLWQSAYTEFYVTDVLWPDFNETQLLKALLDYQSRERRYGGIKG